eukprot:1066559-Pelagomonas_calceolata.AAC.1
MGREPLGLMASGKVHTWLPRSPQGTPRLKILAALPNKKFRQPCSVRGPQPIIRPETRQACQATFFVGAVNLATSGSGTAPVDMNFISILLWMPLLGLGSGGVCPADFAAHLRTIPACR